MEFVKKWGADEKFVWFEKGDVNGAKTREVYSFLKAALKDSDGNADIGWNFTTFLVDHTGEPVKRFSGSKKIYDILQPIVEDLTTAAASAEK